MRDSDNQKPKLSKYPLPQPGDQKDHSAYDVGKDGVSYIAENITMHGDIDGSGDLVVRGKVDGGVQCGTLVVEEGGKVSGDVKVDRLRLMGTIEGSIHCTDVAIEDTALVIGDVDYTRMRMSTGAAVVGQLNYHGDRMDELKAASKPKVGNGSGKVVSGVFEDPNFSRNPQ